MPQFLSTAASHPAAFVINCCISSATNSGKQARQRCLLCCPATFRLESLPASTSILIYGGTSTWLDCRLPPGLLYVLFPLCFTGAVIFVLCVIQNVITWLQTGLVCSPVSGPVAAGIDGMTMYWKYLSVTGGHRQKIICHVLISAWQTVLIWVYSSVYIFQYIHCCTINL